MSLDDGALVIGQDALVPDILIPTQTPDDWRRLLAEPEKHWRTGRSAKALACCWQSAGGFPPEVLAAFNNSPWRLLHDIEMLFGLPELKTPLPGGSRASQTDLFVLAKSHGELISIAVEGKVSEPFDLPISEWLIKGAALPDASGEGVELGEGPSDKVAPVPSPSAGKRRRLSYLAQVLEVSEDALRGTRYQLVHRTVSALIEADRFSAPHALMVVHSFSQTHEWFEDFADFASVLGAEVVEPDTIVRVGTCASVSLYLGWVTGDPKWLAA